MLVENFRPGALERLGLDPETVLLAENPGLVVLRVTGYGQTGPYADRAGFGTMAEAMSTLAHTTGQPDGPPTLPPIALADEVTGLRGAFAVLAALRHRDLTGDGQVIDISLLESLVDIVGPGPSIYHRTGQSDGRIGSRLASRRPATSTLQRRLHRAVRLGEPGRAAGVRRDRPYRPSRRPPVHHRRARIEQRRALDEIITAWTSAHTVAQAIETFTAAGAAVGPVYDAEQLVNDPPRAGARRVSSRSRARPDGAPLLQAQRAPAHVGDAGRDPPRRPAARRLHRAGARAELGYAPDEIDALVAGGAVGSPLRAPAAASLV